MRLKRRLAGAEPSSGRKILRGKGCNRDRRIQTRSLKKNSPFDYWPRERSKGILSAAPGRPSGLRCK